MMFVMQLAVHIGQIYILSRHHSHVGALVPAGIYIAHSHRSRQQIQAIKLSFWQIYMPQTS